MIKTSEKTLCIIAYTSFLNNEHWKKNWRLVGFIQRKDNMTGESYNESISLKSLAFILNTINCVQNSA